MYVCNCAIAHLAFQVCSYNCRALVLSDAHAFDQFSERCKTMSVVMEQDGDPA